MDIKFKSGVMLAFTVKKSFALGATGMQLTYGSEVSFDGTTVEYNGERFVHPQLRGAVKTGWLVLTEDYSEDDVYIPVSANVQVRPAIEKPGTNPLSPPTRSAITAVQNDERIVGNSTQHAAQTRTQNAQIKSAKAGQRVVVASAGSVRTKNGMEVIEDQSGVVVNRAIKTKARQTMELSPDNVGAAISEANKVKIDAGVGMSEEEMLSRMTEEQQEEYLSEKATRRAEVVSRNPHTANLAYEPRVVGKVKTAKVMHSEGFDATLTTGGGTAITDLSDSTAKATVSETYVEGIRVTNTNGPKRDHIVQPARQDTQPRITKDGTEEWRRRIAKALCPDFPSDYNFADHWKRRLAMIRLNYETRADVIQAIFAAESDDFKAQLLEEFPEVFQSEAQV